MNHLSLWSSASSSTQRTRFDCQPGWPGKPRSGLSHVTLPTFVPAGAFSLSEKTCGDGTLGASEMRRSVTATVALILVEGLPSTWAVTTITLLVSVLTLPGIALLPNTPQVTPLIYLVAAAMGTVVGLVGGISAWRRSPDAPSAAQPG